MSRASFDELTKVGSGAAFRADLKRGKHDRQIGKLLRKNYAYDVQAEGSRDWYAFQLFKRAGNRRGLALRFGDHFAHRAGKKYWGHGVHMFDVAYRLHRAGYLKKSLLLNTFKTANREPNGFIIGDNVILKLGKRGVVTYLSLIGRTMVDDTEDGIGWAPTDEYTLKRVSKPIRKVAVGKLGRLARLAYNHIVGYQPEAYSYQPRFTDFTSYVSYVATNRFRSWTCRIAAKFSDGELLRLARSAQQERSGDRLVGLLEPFRTRDYPLAPETLMPLLNHDDKGVRWIVSRILGRYRTPEIRQHAVRQIEAGTEVRQNIGLLAASIRVGDDNFILGALAAAKDQDDLHEINYAIQTVCERADPILLAGNLAHLYRHSRCGVCRQELVRHMERADLLTDRMRKDLRFDTFKPTRKQYRR